MRPTISKDGMYRATIRTDYRLDAAGLGAAVREVLGERVPALTGYAADYDAQRDAATSGSRRCPIGVVPACAA